MDTSTPASSSNTNKQNKSNRPKAKRRPKKKQHTPKSPPASLERLDHNPNVFPQQLLLKEKPSFDLSFLKKSESKCSRLLSSVDDFLGQIPTSSASSAVTASTASPKRPEIDPTSMESIEESWKVATEELWTPETAAERAIEIQMQLCPFQSIPKCLLPMNNDSSDSDSDEAMNSSSKNPDASVNKIEVLK